MGAACVAVAVAGVVILARSDALRRRSGRAGRVGRQRVVPGQPVRGSPGYRGGRARAARCRGAARHRPGRGPRRRRHRTGRSIRGHPPPSRDPQGGRAARRHGLHLPEPGPVHRPGRGRCAAPAPWSSAARAYNAGRRPRRPPAVEPAGRVARYAWIDHYALSARRAARRGARDSRPTAGGRWSWPTTTASSTARPPTGPASGGTARTPTCCCPGWARGSCSARSSPTRRSRRRSHRSPTAAAPCRRCLDGCPTGAIVAPGRGRRPALPGLVGAAGRLVPVGLSRGARRPHLRLRRLPGGVPAQRATPSVGAGSRPRRRQGGDAQAWVPLAGAARRPPTPSCSSGTAAGTSPSATPAGCAATPWWRWATSATAPTRDVEARPARRAGRRRRDAAGACGVGGGPARARDDLLAAGAPRIVRHLLVTNDFPPKVGGIQSYLWELWRRLPPDEFVVLTTPYDGTAEWDRAQPFPVVRSPRAGAAAHTRASGAGSTAWPTRPARRSWSSIRPCPSVSSARRCDHRYAVVVHGAEVTVPGRLPGSRAAPGTGAARRRPRGRRRRLPGGRGRARRRAPSCPPSSSRPASTSSASAPSTTRPGPPCGARLGLPTDVHAGRRPQPPRAPQGLRRPDRGRRAPGRHRAGRWRSPSPAAAATRPASGAWPPPARRRSTSSVGCPTPTYPALYGCADVFAMCCRDRWNGLEQEGFGIVFVEAAAAGVAQVAGDSGGAAEAVTDGETGIVVRHPAGSRGGGHRPGPAARRPGLRCRLGAAARGRAEKRVLLRPLGGPSRCGLACPGIIVRCPVAA